MLVDHLSGMFIWGHPRAQINVIPPPTIASVIGGLLPSIYNPNLASEESSRQVGVAEVQALAEALEQTPPAVQIRQRKIDRLVHPARTGCQGRFQDVRPIRRQQEQAVRLGAETVHLVHQFVEDGGVANKGDYVRPWNGLTNDEKNLFSKMMAVYAGFSEHADEQIQRIVDYLKETGRRIPQDVAVVGFDNQLLIAAQVRPALTAIALPHYELGKQAVQLALSHATDAESRSRRST